MVGSCTDKNEDECMEKVRNFYNKKNVHNSSIDPDDLAIINYVNEVL
jgi:hypothetical protein